MKKALIVAATVFLMGCSTTTYIVGGVTDNTIVKVGEGPARDGVVAAARNAGITKIATIDYRTKKTYFFNWLLSAEQTVIVSGE
jgi:hypothetical protein